MAPEVLLMQGHDVQVCACVSIVCVRVCVCVRVYGGVEVPEVEVSVRSLFVHLHFLACGFVCVSMWLGVLRLHLLAPSLTRPLHCLLSLFLDLFRASACVLSLSLSVSLLLLLSLSRALSSYLSLLLSLCSFASLLSLRLSPFLTSFVYVSLWVCYCLTHCLTHA